MTWGMVESGESRNVMIGGEEKCFLILLKALLALSVRKVYLLRVLLKFVLLVDGEDQAVEAFGSVTKFNDPFCTHV